jgi:hypothetical protein
LLVYRLYTNIKDIILELKKDVDIKDSKQIPNRIKESFMNEDTSYYQEIETQIRLEDLEKKIKKGYFTNPPSNDVDEIKSFFKNEYSQYSDLIFSSDYIKPHVQGRDVGGEIDSSVTSEIKDMLENSSEKVLKAKERHMQGVVEGVTGDSVYYDKEIALGRFDLNHVSDERDVEIITEVNEVVNRYSEENFNRPLVRLNLYHDDIAEVVKAGQTDPCPAQASIVFNSKELKKEGVDIEDITSDLRVKLREELQLPIQIPDEVNKIPDHRMVVDNKSLVFSESEWSDVNSKHKKDLKSAVGIPTADSISSKALSMKL